MHRPIANPSRSRNPNPNPPHSAQAFHFLRLLSRINRPSPGGTHSPAGAIRRRSRRIRLAAYASMACAVGREKAWSSALLRRLRSRKGARSVLGETRRACSVTGEGNRAETLRRLVPGGRRMELSRLLEETGHYIQCLSSQVKVMQCVADFCEAA